MTAVRADALRESAHRVVIRIHLAEGNVAEALHAYRHCSALLEREFGLTPSRETAELVREFTGLQPLLPLLS
jgi:DNA-binding SARP family transcriptional activator